MFAKHLFVSGFIQRLLPSQPCMLCGDMNRHGIWCEPCEQQLPYYWQPHCPICALPTINNEICGHCQQHPPAFNATICLFSYQFPANKLIQQLKYAEQLCLAPTLAQQLAARIQHKPDLVVAMPLHPEKLKQRGFNQSQLLAQQLCRQLKLPAPSPIVQRIRNTASQASQPWSARHHNVKNAFSCTHDLSGKRIALVDDVMTSGASLQALAHTLRQQGATWVENWVIARTLPHHSTNGANSTTGGPARL